MYTYIYMYVYMPCVRAYVCLYVSVEDYHYAMYF